MNKENIKELALDKNELLILYDIVDFKKAFNDIMKNDINPKLNILIYTPPRRIVEPLQQFKLINEIHSKAHIGIRKTIITLKQRYTWKNMNKMVKNFINTCETCLKNKQITHIREPLTLTDTPTKSFETVQIDTVGPLRISNNNRYILTMQCELTKYIIAHPIPTKDAETIAKVMVEQLILKFGHIKVLKSDRGTEFANELMKNVCKLLNIEQRFSTPYHHETVGSLERNHRVMNEYFLTSTHDHEWDKWLPYYMFAYNTTPHTDTEYSPFELIYGKLPYNTETIISEQRTYDLESYNAELKAKLEFSLKQARKYLVQAKENRISHENQKYKNTLDLQEGDLVLLKVENRKKYMSPYKGPYKIVKRLGVNSLISIDNKEKLVHNNSLKRCSI